MDRMDRLIWVPRILAMCVIGFLLLFSFDVFEGSAPMWAKIGGFLIHSIPSLVLAGLLALSWRRPVAVGWVFVAFALAMTVLFHQRWDVLAYILIALPPIVVGVLFIVIGTRLGTKP